MNFERNILYVRFVENKTTLLARFAIERKETTRLLLFGYGRVVLRRYKTNSFRDSQNGLLIDMASSVVRERGLGQVVSRSGNASGEKFLLFTITFLFNLVSRVIAPTVYV